MGKLIKKTQYGLYQVYCGIAQLAGADDVLEIIRNADRIKAANRERFDSLETINEIFKKDMDRLRADGLKAEAQVRP